MLIFFKTFGKNSDGTGMDLGQEEIQKFPLLKETVDISGQTEHTYGKKLSGIINGKYFNHM